MLSARELDVEQLASQARTWTNERLVYTHGLASSPCRSTGLRRRGSRTTWSAASAPSGSWRSASRIYFGEATDTHVVTGTGQRVRLPPERVSEAGATTTWQGTTGVGVDNFFSRLMFALRFGDFNLLISNQLTDESQILFRRAVQERVPELAPFLTYDQDPYIVSATSGCCGCGTHIPDNAIRMPSRSTRPAPSRAPTTCATASRW